MIRFKLLLVCFLILNVCIAQDKTPERNSIITLGFDQVKESANFGLVFKGPGIAFGQGWRFWHDNMLLTYDYELGVEFLFSRQIPALGFHFKPADLSYLFRIPISANDFYIGPSMKFEYNYNLYPDLQSGFDYWFTNFSVGIHTEFDFNYNSSQIRILLNTSLIGLTSRQPAYRDPYFYDLGLMHALSHLHQDLAFGSEEAYNTTRFEVWWKPGGSKRNTFASGLLYMGYYDDPKISMLNIYLKLIIGKKNSSK